MIIRFILLLFIASISQAATWTLTAASANVCNGASVAGTFNKSLANFSCVHGRAACGDIIAVEPGSITITSGTTITLAKSCPVGTEVRIQPNDTSWLPTTGARILPSHLTKIPYFLATGAFSNQAMITYSSQPGDKGVIWDGFGLVLDSTYSVSTFNPYVYAWYIGNINLTNTNTTADLADNIQFNRTLLLGPYDVNKTMVGNWLLDSKTFVLTNSYVGGMSGTTPTNTGGGTQESKPVLAFPITVGPITLTNNVFCCGWTASFFTGGNNAVFTTGSPIVDGITYKNNISINALRFMPGTDTYVGDANVPSIKNCWELKEGLNSVFRHNTCLNSWQNAFSQYFGTKISIYNQVETPGCTTPQYASLSVGNTRVTIPGAAGAGIIVGRALGMPTVASPGCSQNQGGFTLPDFEYRYVTAVVDAVNHIYDVNSAYTGVFGGATTNLKWALSWNPWWYTQNVNIEGNVFRNVAQAFSFEGSDTALLGPSLGNSTLGTTSNLVFRNNLQYIDSPQANFGSVSIHPALSGLNRGGTNILLEKNTQYIASTAHATAQTQDYVFTFSALTPFLINNLSLIGNYSTKTSFGVQTGATVALATDTNFTMINNSFLGTPYSDVNGTSLGGCNSGGRRCLPNYLGYLNSGNINYRFINSNQQDFRLDPGKINVSNATNANPVVYTTNPGTFLLGQSVRAQNIGGNAGANKNNLNVGTFVNNTTWTLFDTSLTNTIGTGAYTSGGQIVADPWMGNGSTDVGADMSQVALIRNLIITPAAEWITFRWRLPSALSNVVCQIEVSTDSTLTDDTGSYTVANAINPSMFKQSDQDNVNSRAVVDTTGTVRRFQVGAAATVTDDNGVSRNLRLTPSTAQYYRLFCGGAFERGSTATTAP